MRTTQFILALLLLAITAYSTARAADENLEALEEQAMKSAIAEVAPSVVRIETFGGLEKIGEMLVGTGPTTGLIVDEDGYVLSSAFNFIQQPSSILVTLADGKRASAQIVSRDNSRMIVLLKVDTNSKLPVPQFVDRKEMLVGQWTMAVGRTFDKSQTNMSVGILSAVNRVWGKAIQTDAKISPSNYGGPLIDIRGRVLGLLVPLSPQSTGDVAGAEWYDSGIGFAIPIVDIMPHLDSMKEGNDLHPGLMGITLKSGDIYGQAAEVVSVQAKSPAKEAGVLAGDVIVKADDIAIERQAQLKHVLGSKYAGDSVALVLRREKKQVEATLELAKELEPYEHPFFGILPERNFAGETGVKVRYVYGDSPAATAKIHVGDVLLTIDGKAVTDVARAHEILAAFEPKAKIKITFRHGDEDQEAEIELASLPEAIPEKLPAIARTESNEKDDAAANDAKKDDEDDGVIDIRLPEQENQCVAIVPENYDANRQYGLFVWLSPPDKLDKKKLAAKWKTPCAENDLIFLAPQPSNDKRWQATDVEFIRKTIEQITKDYSVDRTRVVVHGYQAGGAVAFLTAFGHRDLVRGVASVGASVPARSRPVANDPAQRLGIYVATDNEGRSAERDAAVAKRLREMKYPVVAREAKKYLDDAQLVELFRWIDTLDRI